MHGSVDLVSVIWEKCGERTSFFKGVNIPASLSVVLYGLFDLFTLFESLQFSNRVKSVYDNEQKTKFPEAFFQPSC
jgi:hypothetical protein